MTENILTVFEFKSNQVRVIEIDGETWFVAKDICNTLSLADVSKVCSRLDDDEKGTHTIPTLGGNQDMMIVSESGLYSLVLTSRKPEAKAFKKWVTSEVLPSIRKTGKYAITKQEVDVPTTYLDALKALVESEETKLKLEQEKKLLEAEKELLEAENIQLSETVDELFDYSSIVRVAIFNGIHESNFSWRKLKAVSQMLDTEIKKVPDARYEYKLLYSHDAWRLAYPNVRLPETTTLIIRQSQI